jgi:hypothetical protein
MCPIEHLISLQSSNPCLSLARSSILSALEIYVLKYVRYFLSYRHE